MRSGSPAQDDGNWSSPQRPRSPGAMGNPVHFGSGSRGEPHEVPGAARREAPFGPEVSWPYGFRPLDPESREVLESAYGTGPLNPGRASGSVYQPQVMDDYGDPGYSDPSYEGPYQGSSGGPVYPGQSGFPGGAASSAASFDPGSYGRRPTGGSVPGYQLPDAPRVPETPWSGYQAPAPGGDIWPVTGAQETLPDASPRPSADTGRGSSRPGQASYPEQWYDSPRLDDRALEDQRPARSPDPRLEGITYGELRYDDTGSFGAVQPGQEPGPAGDALDDESWYQELRRSAPAYPQNPPVPGSPLSGPQRRMDPPGPAFGPSSGGYLQAPDRAPGFGQPRWDGPDRSQNPQFNANRPAGRGAQAPQSPSGPGPAARGHGFLSAPAASVGLLTPPGGTRVDSLRNGGALPAAPVTPEVPATPAFTPAQAAAAAPAAPEVDAPGATRPRPAAVRPGHGLDGPSTTSSWPTQPAGGDVEQYDDFWRDDADEEYTGLFGDREAEFKRAAAKQAAAAKRQIGRRRGRSNDHRLWLGLGAVVVIAAGAIGGIVKFEFGSGQSGPAHTVATPNTIGSFTRTASLEHGADLTALREKVIKMSAGQATNVVTAVYESGNSAAGNNTQIVMFVGGHLAHADPAASVAGFTQQFKGAQVVSAGPGGGKAACVKDGNTAALCAWFDNDSFGEVVSPSMNAAELAKQMQAFRPSVEIKAPKS